MSQEMAVRCPKRKIAVRHTGKEFVTDEACPESHGPGIEVSELMTLCMSCPQRNVTPATTQPTAEATPAATEPPAAAVDPEPPAAPPVPEAPVPPVAPTEVPPVQKSSGLPDAVDVPGMEAPTAPAPEPPATIPGTAEVDHPAPVAEPKIVLPDGYQLFPIEGDESMVDIEAAVRPLIGDMAGPSFGGLSSHILADFQMCPRRAFLSHMLGLEPVKGKYHLKYGSLFHAALAMKYQFGYHRMTEVIETAIQAGAAEMAHNVRLLVEGMHSKYAAEELETWCPRAIEQNAVFFLERQRINGKSVRVPISSKIDMILALKNPGEPCPGLGPCPQGVYVVDHKTSSGMTYDLTQGYGMDFQFKTYTLAYLASGLQEVHGKLNGIMINLAVKRKKKITDDNFFRERCPYPTETVHEFLNDELAPAATELWRRMGDESYHGLDGMKKWPKHTTQCVGRWGMCDFFNICDGGSPEDRINYKVDEGKILMNKEFAEPPAPSSLKETKEEEVEKRKDRVGELNKSFVASFAKGLLAGIEQGDQSLLPLHPQNFLVPGHTEKKVKPALAKALKAVYAGYIDGKFKWDAEHPFGTVKHVFQKTGIKWVIHPGANGSEDDAVSGRMTWVQIANAICELEWFNMSRVKPQQEDEKPIIASG